MTHIITIPAVNTAMSVVGTDVSVEKLVISAVVVGVAVLVTVITSVCGK